MIRTKGEAGTGDVRSRKYHARQMTDEIRIVQNAPEEELMSLAKSMALPMSYC